MIRSSVRLLAVSCAVLVGCATARPIFQMSFRGLGRDTRDRWMELLAKRYECDTAMLRGIAAPTGAESERPATVDMGTDVRGNRLVAPNPSASPAV